MQHKTYYPPQYEPNKFTYFWMTNMEVCEVSLTLWQAPASSNTFPVTMLCFQSADKNPMPPCGKEPWSCNVLLSLIQKQILFISAELTSIRSVWDCSLWGCYETNQRQVRQDMMFVPLWRGKLWHTQVQVIFVQVHGCHVTKAGLEHSFHEFQPWSDHKIFKLH